MAETSEPAPVHCYTNPSFCRQSEYIPEDQAGGDLPPPPQFQCGGDDLPPPPPPLQLQCNGGQTNPAFQEMGENRVAEKCGEAGGGRYRCYLDGNNVNNSAHRRYGSVPFEEHRSTYNQGSRYEYIEDEERSHVQRRGSLRYEFIPRQQVQQRSAPAANQDDGQMPSCRNNGGRYAVVPGDQDYQDEEAPWNTVKRVPSARRHINTPQGRLEKIRNKIRSRFFFPETRKDKRERECYTL